MSHTKNVRIAIIGLGHIGKIQVAALNDSTAMHLAAACDQDKSLSALVPKSVSFFSSHHDLLNHGGFETVIVATPNRTHNSIAMDVLSAGFNVIVEKPAANNIDDLEALETEACSRERHVYYAFHAACASEVAWLTWHLSHDSDNYGPITGFISRFFDPYTTPAGQLMPHAQSLDNCWRDSGVNALSVLDRIIPADKFAIHSRQQCIGQDRRATIISLSAHYKFPVNGNDSSGEGIIETAWDQAINFKSTELCFAQSGWRLTMNHSEQSVSACSPTGEIQRLVVFEGDRLLNHYRNLFADYYQRYELMNMNYYEARRIHHALFSVESL